VTVSAPTTNILTQLNYSEDAIDFSPLFLLQKLVATPYRLFVNFAKNNASLHTGLLGTGIS